MSIVLCPRLNEVIQDLSRKLVFNVADIAPSTFEELNKSAVGSLTVFAGASDSTIYGDPRINWLFRAMHDFMHLRYRLDFTYKGEVALARITAGMPEFQGQLADIVYAEIGGQVEYFRANGSFPEDQVKFIKGQLGLRL